MRHCTCNNVNHEPEHKRELVTQNTLTLIHGFDLENNTFVTEDS